MNEPRRLREETESVVERALLDAGVAYRSSRHAHAKTLGALGLAGSVAVSGTAGSAVLNKLGWVKVLATMSAVGAAVGVPAGYYFSQSNPGSPPAVVANAKTPKASAGQPKPELAPVRPVAPFEPAPEARTPVLAAPSLVPKVESRPASRGTSLSLELEALDAVRASLARGEARSALSHLEAYARVYPRGRLQLEAEVLRIDALAKSGQGDSAKRRAESFLRRHPNSVLGSRVRGYLDG